MSWQIVRLDEMVPAPWRNGGGVTRELACWPDSRDWIWRMSVAEVASDGPFSRFEGVQRWFAVLGGSGVRLRIGDRAHEQIGSSAPLCFDGAEPADCELLDGATQDFNLMLRRPQASARMRRISGAEAFRLAVPTTVALYAIDDGARILVDGSSVALPEQSLAWQAMDSELTVQVQAGTALWMEIEL